MHASLLWNEMLKSIQTFTTSLRKKEVWGLQKVYSYSSPVIVLGDLLGGVERLRSLAARLFKTVVITSRDA